MIPPARPEANPLLRILERRGAETLEFPALKTAPPADYGPMDRAIQRVRDFDYIIFSGTNCVINFLKCLKAHQLDKEALRGPKIAAIGHGAVSALNKEGIDIQYVPKLHTAEGVTAGLGETSNARFLLVRAEGASRSLPERLMSLGAKVSEVAGYRMLVDAPAEMVEKAFGPRIDALALANPTSVRFFLIGAEKASLNLEDWLKEVTIASVGPATAKAAARYGLTSHIVSRGHIADLAESLTHFFAKA
jgi:uroporphyrinogen III methyltransferase/synthase